MNIRFFLWSLVLDKRNYSRNVFIIGSVQIFITPFLVLAHELGVLVNPRDASPVVLGAMALCSYPVWYIYIRFLGPTLRRRGFDEYSLRGGVQVLFAVTLIFAIEIFSLSLVAVLLKRMCC